MPWQNYACMEISGVILPAFQPNAIEDVISFL
jgi:hypothetical protein